MKKIVALALSAVMMLSVFAGCGNSADNSKEIAYMAKGESHAFWQSIKKGAQAAADKYGYTLNYAGPDTENPEDIPQQQEQINAALARKPGGVVMATIGSGFSTQLNRIKDENIPLVTFDSGIKDDGEKEIAPISAHVASSNELAAAAAAKGIWDEIKADVAAHSTTDKYNIGIIRHDGSITGLGREAGFKDEIMKLADADASTKGKIDIKTDQGAERAYPTSFTALGGRDKLDLVFMTNEVVVNEMSDAVPSNSELYAGVKFVGFDAGLKQYNWMTNEGDKYADSPLIGSVAQDSYQMGFQSVEQVINKIEGKTVKNIELPGVFYNKDNIEEQVTAGIVYK